MTAAFIAGLFLGVFVGVFVMALCAIAKRSDEPQPAPEPLRNAPKVEVWNEQPDTAGRRMYDSTACKVPPEVTARWFERKGQCRHGVSWENRCPECEA